MNVVVYRKLHCLFLQQFYYLLKGSKMHLLFLILSYHHNQMKRQLRLTNYYSHQYKKTHALLRFF